MTKLNELGLLINSIGKTRIRLGNWRTLRFTASSKHILHNSTHN